MFFQSFWGYKVTELNNLVDLHVLVKLRLKLQNSYD